VTPTIDRTEGSNAVSSVQVGVGPQETPRLHAKIVDGTPAPSSPERRGVLTAPTAGVNWLMSEDRAEYGDEIQHRLTLGLSHLATAFEIDDETLQFKKESKAKARVASVAFEVKYLAE